MFILNNGTTILKNIFFVILYLFLNNPIYANSQPQNDLVILNTTPEFILNITYQVGHQENSNILQMKRGEKFKQIIIPSASGEYRQIAFLINTVIATDSSGQVVAQARYNTGEEGDYCAPLFYGNSHRAIHLEVIPELGSIICSRDSNRGN